MSIGELPNPEILPVLGRYDIYPTSILGGVNESIDLESAEPIETGYFIKNGSHILPIPESGVGITLEGKMVRLLREDERTKVINFKKRTITEYSPLDKFCLIECDINADMIRIHKSIEKEDKQPTEGETQ